MAPDAPSLEITEDAVLGGRLRLRQPRRGHRVGHDAILLAAATAGRDGEHAIDFGAGVGAAGLALASRVDGLSVTLIEIDPALATLASENAALNGLDRRVRVLAANVEHDAALAVQGLTAGCADRVLMNPPFNDPRRQNVSPDARRRLAHVADPGLLGRWVDAAARLLKPDGVLTLIWRAEDRTAVMDAVSRHFGTCVVLPVLPRAGEPPIRILVRAQRGSSTPSRELPGLVLNDAGGKSSAEAEAVLRHAGTLGLGD